MSPSQPKRPDGNPPDPTDKAPSQKRKRGTPALSEKLAEQQRLLGEAHARSAHLERQLGQIMHGATVDLRAETRDPIDALYLAKGQSFVLDVPLDRCRGAGLQTADLTAWDNPFVQTLRRFERDGARAFAGSPLERYYAAYTPGTAAAGHGLKKSSGLALLPPPGALLMPWTPTPADIFMHEIQEGTKLFWQSRGIDLDLDQGATEFGPVSRAKGEQEMRRTIDVYEDIRANGYIASRAPIVGTLLVGEGHRWACHIRDGLHRCAAMIALGHAHIPILFRGGDTAACVRRDEAAFWPQVRNGPFTPDEALHVFDRLSRPAPHSPPLWANTGTMIPGLTLFIGDGGIAAFPA